MSETPSHCSAPLASNVWSWYGQDEYRKIILLGELGPALALLGWTEVHEHIPELIEDCRAALRKWPD